MSGPGVIERAAILAVGSELLRFARRDTNGEWLTAQLLDLGVQTVARGTVADEAPAIEAWLRQASELADVVLVTGGLGPTEDDRTRYAVASLLGVPLDLDEEFSARLRAAFEARGRSYGADQDRQVMRPRGAEWLFNSVGVAPGVRARHGSTVICALPGVPAEMRAIFDEELRPWLGQGSPGSIVRRTLRVGGRTESEVNASIRDFYDVPGVELTILTGREGVELHLLAAGEGSEAEVDRVEQEMIAALGADLYGRGDELLADRIGRLLIERGETLAVAESCTAGMIGANLTAISGSSVWFRGGVIPYHDDLKRAFVGIPPRMLEVHGAVSEAVARELARGIRETAGADWGLAITGIAGPGGARPDKPVGTVHLGVNGPGVDDHVLLQLIGDRALIRRRSSVAALDRLRRRLEGAARYTSGDGAIPPSPEDR